MANWTAWVSVFEISDSTMPSASEASRTSTIAAATQSTSPWNGTSSAVHGGGDQDRRRRRSPTSR